MSPPPSTPYPSVRPAAGANGDAGAKKSTLSPPEWGEREGPRSAASLALERHEREAPVARHIGPRAELAYLRARLHAASSRGDAEGERSAGTALARALAARGAELDNATKLARKALLLGEDPALREELSGWFAGLGEPALAAATLRPLLEDQAGDAAARILTRIAVLLARAGDAQGAADALSQAALAHASDPVAPELYGAIGAWAPAAVSPDRAAAGYLEGASRQEAAGERSAAFEDLLRAFEMAPEAPAAAERLAQALAERGRAGAADEVLREHARALGARGRAVHLRRMRDALAEGDVARAVGAGLDARLDAELDPEGALCALEPREGGAPAEPMFGFDEVLLRAGLHELLAARLEVMCDALEPPERARARLAAARLYSGPLASPDRAAEAWVDALVANPASEEAKASLRAHAAATRDLTPITEALIRVGSSRAPISERLACLRELVVLAEQRLADPGLALWAVRKILAAGLEDDELSATAARLAPRAQMQDEALASARVALESATGRERLEPLRRSAGILRGRPEMSDALLAVLRELVELAPEERGWQGMLERTLARHGRVDEIEAALTSFVQRSTASMELERGRLALSAIKRRRQDIDGAFREIDPLLRSSAAHTAAWAMAVLLADRLGDPSIRARALLRMASPLAPSLRAVVSSVAAEAFLAGGDIESAREAGELGAHADPSQARPIAARAAVAVARLDRAGAAALERAMGVVVPRAALCQALADAYLTLGEAVPALAWAQRRLALRPGDPRAAQALLLRVTESGDGARLGDALGWLMSQPQPLHELAAPLGAALRKLASLDPSRGAALARRALDVLGPRSRELRDSVLAVADVVGERGLGIAVVERWLAAGAPGADRAELLLDVARRRKAAGDADGAARAMARAVLEGADATAVLAELDVALAARSSDGELALLEARAEALSALSAADLEGAARAWRELGAARWDLAGDPLGAVSAWERAAVLDRDRGISRLAGDLVAFAGHAEAIERLEGFAGRRHEPADAAAALAVAASLALQSGWASEALRIASRALEIDPSRPDVLAVAERSAGPGDVGVLERIYDRLANVALGCYGERAAHYRAARQFERRGESTRGLSHAIRAFESVPAEGVTFVLMARLAERTGKATELVSALERVAQKSPSNEARADWLRRAALFAGSSDEGKRQRVDVLLRALSVRADAETLKALGAALAELVALAPEDKDIVELRYQRALDGLLPRVDGPEGARLSCHAARVALDSFDSASLALVCVTRAIECDADIDEFAALEPYAPRLANAPEAARAFVARTIELAGQRFANVGRALLELSAALAREFDDTLAVALLLMQAARRDPEDPLLYRRAEAAAQASGDNEVIALLLDAIPPRERVVGLLDLAANADRDGDVPGAIDALERALATDAIEDVDRRRVFDRLRELYARVGRRDGLEQMLVDELDRVDTDAERRMLLTRDLAALVGARGDAERALKILDTIAQTAPDHEGLLGDLVEAARQAGDGKRRADALGRLADLAADPTARLGLLRELAPLLEDQGERALAYARWAELLELDPNDVGAIAALERDAEARGDYERLVELLTRRAALASMVDDVRRIHLHRAAVLEQRLGRPDDARAELEAVLAATGDNLSVLRMLADLNERLGAQLRAAALWLRASAVSRDRDEASDLARRACEAYLGGGDVDSARRVLDGMEAWARSTKVAGLRVEVERRNQNPIALGEALEELALASLDPPEQRAQLLVEAARAALTGGDAVGALARAQRAARIAPNAAEPQLCARWLEYLSRGTGSTEEARISAAELRSVEGELSGAQSELMAFLLAEALDVAVGTGAGLRELSLAHAELGSRALLALGLAERLAASDEPARALPLFDAALAGDLQRIRTRGRVAVRAAEAARALGELERALGYLETAVLDPDSRAEALGLQAEIRTELRPDPEADRRVESARAAAESSGASTGSVPPGALEPAPLVPVDTTARSDEPYEEPRRLPPSDRPPRGSDRPVPLAGDRPARASDRPARSDERPSQPPRADEGDAGYAPRMPEIAPESRLFHALDKGSAEAGKELIQQLENRADRTHDLVGVCRRLALLLPGDRWTLDKLLDAARTDRNVVYARAVEHVLAASTGAKEPIDPPPLADQPEHPDSVRALLFRGSVGPAAEALALVWEGAEHIFRRDPGTYGVTGMERIPVGAQTPLGRVYSGAARVLGLTRTPLFQRRSAGTVTLSVAPLSPPALILSGEVRSESAELRFHVGAMLAAAMPQFVLLFGAPESQARAVLRGLSLAFGAPKPGQSSMASVANLAEVLWESIPARSQRRLRELCDDARALDYETALANARLAARRAGLFVAGDLRIALRATCADEGIPAKVLEEPDGLAALCSASPAVSDLVRLATSPEYAEARWQPGRAGGRHPTGTFATF